MVKPIVPHATDNIFGAARAIARAIRLLRRRSQREERLRSLLLGTAAAEGWPAAYCDCEPCTEARRRGVEAIVLAAEEPTRVRGGPILGGRGRSRDRFVGETTRYVLEKAPCRVILTAAPAGEEGQREGVAP